VSPKIRISMPLRCSPHFIVVKNNMNEPLPDVSPENVPQTRQEARQAFRKIIADARAFLSEYPPLGPGQAITKSVKEQFQADARPLMMDLARLRMVDSSIAIGVTDTQLQDFQGLSQQANARAQQYRDAPLAQGGRRKKTKKRTTRRKKTSRR
jgi:hypothetical protein